MKRPAMAMTRLLVSTGLYGNGKKAPAIGLVRGGEQQVQGVWIRALGVGVWLAVENGDRHADDRGVHDERLCPFWSAEDRPADARR